VGSYYYLKNPFLAWIFLFLNKMNSKNLKKLVKPNILNLAPYHCARHDFSSGILMDANENPYGTYNRYGDPYQAELREKIAKFRGMKKENIICGNGSDEIIDLILRIFCISGKDNIIINPPTYGMYKVAADINNIPIKEVPLNDEFQLDLDKIFKIITKRTKIIFICSPNNPTANLMNRSDIEKLLGKFRGIVILDEAYIDFAKQKSLVLLVKKYPNLIITQTLSKAFGLAGIRLGIAIADPFVINLIMNVKAPYNINVLTYRLACKAFSNIASVHKNIGKILENKKILEKELKNLGIKIYPSDANFFLFKIDNALDVYQKLSREGIIIRYFGDKKRLDNKLRVSVGTRLENQKFLKNLRIILGK